MKSGRKKSKAFKGAGILVGFAIGIAAAVVIFAITGNIALTGPLTAGLGVPLGISFEKKFQGQIGDVNPIVKKTMVILVALGAIVLSAFFFLVKLI